MRHDDARRFLREFADFLDVWTGDAVLDGSSDRRSDIQDLHESVGAWKGLMKIGLQVGFQTVASLKPLCDDDHLAEGRIVRLDIERQNEARRSATDKARPVIDVGVPDKLFTLEDGHLPICFSNGAVLRQVPVDDQFRTIRRGKELLLDKRHAGDGQAERGDRHDDGGPAETQAELKQPGEDGAEAALVLGVFLHRLRQDRHAE